jgi:small subunit ribosomal protein S18
VSRFTISDENINFKSIKDLKRCVTENGKIIPARLTRLDCARQRRMAQAIKHARFLALLPYTVG